MVLHKAQSKIATDAHRFRVVVCGRKFGKTSLSGEEIAGCAIAKGGRRVIYIAPTLNDARRLMWGRLRNQLEKALLATNEVRLELKVRTVDGGESIIFLGSWELVENYRGDEFDFIVFDEVQEYRGFWVGWMEAMRPTLTPRAGTALFIGTPKGFNHLYDLFNLQSGNDEWRSFQFTTYENPYIAVEEIDAARRTLTEDRFAQEYLADFRKQEGLVYKEFNRGNHLYPADKELSTYETLGGVDFGYNNPAAVLSVAVDLSKRYWVTDEWYKMGKTDAEVADFVSSQRFSLCYPDPENAGGVEELRRRSVNVREVNKGKGSVVAGIQTVRELLKAQRLHISEKCINLIEEIESYAYPEEKEDRNEDELPVKYRDHLLDALRYAIHTYEVSRTPVKLPPPPDWPPRGAIIMGQGVGKPKNDAR